MNITLQLDAETERRLNEAAANRGMTVDKYVQWLVERPLPAPLPGHAQPLDVWLAEWKAWVESHKPLPHIADDDRESIYAGCGE